MGCVWEDDFVEYQNCVTRDIKKTRSMVRVNFVALVVLTGFLFVLAMKYCESTSHWAAATFDRMDHDISDIHRRQSIDSEHSHEMYKIQTTINDSVRSSLDRFDGSFTRIDHRLDEFNNACDLTCSKASADYFNLASQINALEEDNRRQEELIKGLFRNFDLAWSNFAYLKCHLDGLAAEVAHRYNKPPSSSLQRIRIRRR